MRLPVKMCAIIIVGILVVLYQYHLSKTWIIPQPNDEIHQEMYIRIAIGKNKSNSSKIDNVDKSCVSI